MSFFGPDETRDRYRSGALPELCRYRCAISLLQGIPAHPAVRYRVWLRRTFDPISDPWVE